jgi:hypothetical protein
MTAAFASARAGTDNRRVLFTEGTPAFAAKNRFGMAAKIPIPLEFDFANLAQHWAIPGETHDNQHCT